MKLLVQIYKHEITVYLLIASLFSLGSGGKLPSLSKQHTSDSHRKNR